MVAVAAVVAVAVLAPVRSRPRATIRHAYGRWTNLPTETAAERMEGFGEVPLGN